MEKKIKTSTTTRYNYAYKQETEEWVIISQYITNVECYDQAGNVISEQTFNRDGDLGENNEYIFDDQGRLLEEHIYFDGRELAEKHLFEYNENGKIGRKFTEYQDGSRDTTEYTYNNDGLLILKQQFDEEGEEEGREEYEYADKLVVLERITDSFGNTSRETINRYDSEGRLIETIFNSPEETECIRTVHEYDEKGNRDCIEKYQKDGNIISRDSYTFDDKGNAVEMLEETAYATNKTILTYDEKGHAVMQEEYNEKEELNSRIERTWDENDRMIETAIYIDDHGQGPEKYYVVKNAFDYYEGE
jgi:hypothetical protein